MGLTWQLHRQFWHLLHREQNIPYTDLYKLVSQTDAVLNDDDDDDDDGHFLGHSAF